MSPSALDTSEAASAGPSRPSASIKAVSASSALAADLRLADPKGEIVIVVGPGEEEAASAEDADTALIDALGRLGPADAASEVSKALGLKRRDLYRRALELKGDR